MWKIGVFSTSGNERMSCFEGLGVVSRSQGVPRVPPRRVIVASERVASSVFHAAVQLFPFCTSGDLHASRATTADTPLEEEASFHCAL